jgi:hypothetical protein
MDKELIDGLIMRLIKRGLTYSIEADPLIIRPVDAELLVNTIMEYLQEVGYANPSTASIS